MPAFLNKEWFACEDFHAVDRGGNAFAGRGAKVTDRLNDSLFPLRIETDRLSKRMFGRSFDCADQGKKFLPADSERDNICDRGPSVGQRAGLVKNKRVGDGESMKYFACLYKEANRDAFSASDGCEQARYGPKAGQWNSRFLDAKVFNDLVLTPYREAKFEQHIGPFLFKFQRHWMPSKEFCSRLDTFFTQLPKDFHYAVEIRNAGLLGPIIGKA